MRPYWIIKFRDASKRKNAKPVNVFWWDGDGNVRDLIENIWQDAGIDALTNIVIEARHMTKAEADKWDRQVDREERKA